MTLRTISKLLLIILSIAVIGFATLIIYAVISDYKPAPQEEIFKSGKADILDDNLEISLLTWNIGYCGLDRDMDFFYDGGKKVFTSREKCLANLNAVKNFFEKNDSVSFILIQEIDKNSKRSYHLNEYDTLSRNMPGYHPFFAKNYDVFFVPVPPSSPMGKVESGLAIFSKYQPASSVRYTFPGEYGFPKQLFMLDRCFLVNRYPLENGRELLIINTHNEAYDPGEIRKTQMAYLKEFLLAEYGKGNYIITGGDWNQSPPGFQPGFKGNKVNTDQMMMDKDYMSSDWNWVFDNRTPSNRSVSSAYDPATTTTTVIDLYLLSPNIECVRFEGVDLGFENSDHNPVIISAKLKPQV